MAAEKKPSPLTDVRVRIAPSPTGRMHVGTARAALFNKLFALAQEGTYLVRIEDTDSARSTAENIAFIQDALGWLGLAPDADYVIQSANKLNHIEAAQTLLKKGLAYTDDGAIRFKVPEGRTGWEDLIQGYITYENTQIEDFVLLRSDGSPTYHLGVVVDDAHMQISHVIRGDDHINNTPKQILLYEALEQPVPRFAHMPMVLSEDGSKLSKRHGAVSVQEFREEGYLAAAVNHFLMQLGWLPGDEIDPITLQEAAQRFELTALRKSAAVFDAQKLLYINSSYIRQQSAADLLDDLKYLLPEYLSDHHMALLLKALPALQERAKTLLDVQQGAQAFLREPPFSFSADQKHTIQEGEQHLHVLREELADATWNSELLHQIIKDYVQDNGLKFPEVGKPLRLALTGEAHGIGLADILTILGKETTLQRLDHTISQV